MNLTPKQLAALRVRMETLFPTIIIDIQRELNLHNWNWKEHAGSWDDSHRCLNNDPLQDLNAVHRLEEKLTDQQHYYYRNALTKVIRPEFTIVRWDERNERSLISATALLRCIALDRTLNPTNPIV